MQWWVYIVVRTFLAELCWPVPAPLATVCSCTADKLAPAPSIFLSIAWGATFPSGSSSLRGAGESQAKQALRKELAVDRLPR